MQSKFTIYNTLSRSKEEFIPLNPPFVGLYVCGPTVYGYPHLGHARSAIAWDLLFRYLQDLDYKVRYVRNITDVGHLESDADEGEDKIAKQARMDELEPMEVAQYYTNAYHRSMDKLNVLRPSIEPLASGHIIEQIALIEEIIDKGFAYESNGSVYFDIEKYAATDDNNYGKLSGRDIEDMLENTRSLYGQEDKKNPLDFALWKKASPEHIMRWPSPWGVGFPGWHLECSAMSVKYLGEKFDIHGGGLDLVFPHHECEIAQNRAACGHDAAKYWMHNNMVTIDGQKMGKSLGNFITLDALFSGDHKYLSQAYSPMTLRLFILQAHYRSPLDFSEDALQASEKGLARLMNAIETLDKIESSESSSVDIADLKTRFEEAMNDDLNSPIAVSVVFDWVRIINQIHDGKQTISSADLKELKALIHRIVFDVFGLENETLAQADDKLPALIEMILDIRNKAKTDKDWATSDSIREKLTEIGVVVKDHKDGTDWELN